LGVLDQKGDFGEDWSSILLWKISYTYTNENPYCEACSAEAMPVQLKPVLSNRKEGKGDDLTAN